MSRNRMTVFRALDSRRALVVEDSFERIPWFRAAMPQATIVRHPEHAVDALKAHEFTYIFLDGDLLCPLCLDGLHVARHLAETRFAGRVVVHSANYWLANRMTDVLQKAGVCVRRCEWDTPAFAECATALGLLAPALTFPVAALAPTEPEPKRVTWEFWRISQSQARYRGIGVVDLGEIE